MGYSVRVLLDSVSPGGVRLVTMEARYPRFIHSEILTHRMFSRNAASSRALPTIAAGLRQLGAQVTQVEAYRTQSATLDIKECRAWIARGGIGAVTFASPSAVSELAQALGASDFQRLLADSAAVAIGRTTAAELYAHGHAAVVAESATLHGLALTTLRLLQTRA